MCQINIIRFSINDQTHIFLPTMKLKTSIRLLKILSAEHESLVALINPLVLQQYNEIIRLIRTNTTIPLQIIESFKTLRPVLYEVLNVFNVFQISDSRSYSFEQSDTFVVLSYMESIMIRAAEIHSNYSSLQHNVGNRIVPSERVPTDLEILRNDSKVEAVGKFYANRPVLCTLQHYQAIDKSTTKSLNNNEPSMCQKRFETKQKYSGGIMAFWCEHGISYGFHMIETSEALRDVMCAILMHWKTAPSLIIYDNACHLMKYCHSREWGFFKNTTFLIDEFHQYNHTACTEAHNLKRYKISRATKYLFTNSSVAESGNADLVKIKPSVHYMKADSGFQYTLTQLEIQNVVKTNKLVLSKPANPGYDILNEIATSESADPEFDIIMQSADQEDRAGDSEANEDDIDFC